MYIFTSVWWLQLHPLPWCTYLPLFGGCNFVHYPDAHVYLCLVVATSSTTLMHMFTSLWWLQLRPLSRCTYLPLFGRCKFVHYPDAHTYRQIIWIQSAGGAKYFDCTHAKTLSPITQTSVIDMTLNCIWLLGSSPEDLGNVEYPLLSLLPGLPWVVVHVSIQFLGQTELFNHSQYLKPLNCV